MALRGNYSTLDKEEVIIDRRAGRHIEKEEEMGSVKTWVKQMRNRTQNWDVWYIDTVVK